MEKKKQRRIVILIVCLLMATLACSSGSTTSHTLRGNQGQVVVKTNSADGSDQSSIEINEDYTWETIQMTISVTVEAGTYQATFVDANDTTVVLDSSAGNPASAGALMETDGFGKISIQSEASSAEGIVITIDYTTPY